MRYSTTLLLSALLVSIAILLPSKATAQTSDTAPLVRALTAADVNQQAQARVTASPSATFNANAQNALTFTRHVAAGGVGLGLYAEIVDLDGDGKNDILSAANGANGLAFYRNTGDFTFTSTLLSANANSPGATVIQTIDIDKDGDLDIAVSDFFGGRVLWFENTGNLTFTQHIVTTVGGQALGLAVADFNGDGHLDMVAGRQNELQWHENDGNQSFTRRVITNGTFGYLEVADLDKDQDLDIIPAAPFGAGLHWFENDGTGSFTQRTIDATHNSMDTFVADLNGDGHLDISTTNGDIITVFLNNGSQTFTQSFTDPGNTAPFIQQIEGGDVDLDGDIDLVMSTPQNNEGILWFENDGSGTGFTKHVIDAASTQFIAVGDLDGNGSLEVATSDFTNLLVYENPLSAIIPVGSFSILESNDNSTVTEGGMTDQITVSVAGLTNTVSLNITSSDPNQLTATPSSLFFNRDNADQLQTITLTANDDALLDGTQTATVSVSIDIGASDSQFSQLPDQTVSVSVADNEMAGFSITESNGSTTTSEAGASDTFEVTLSAEPLSDVTINLASGTPGQATVNPMMLTFGPGSGTQPQTVTVSAVDDASVDGEQTVTITASVDAALSDDAFDGVGSQTVSVTVTDNDTVGYTIGQSGGTTSVTEAGPGSADTFTISLDVPPAAGTSVLLKLMSSDEGEATVSPSSITFTAGGTTSETITVTGVNDMLPDGNQMLTVSVVVDEASTDSRFTSLPDQVVHVQVLGVNNPPTATDDTPTVTEDGTLTIPVLANDMEPDGQSLGISSHTNTSIGTLTLNNDNTFTYTPNANANGTDTFTYTIDDGNGGTDEATVTITVAPVPDAPVATNDFFEATFNAPTQLDVLGNDNDADGDPLTITILPGVLATINQVSVSDSGTPSDLTDDVLVFTPKEGFVGFDRVDYQIADASGLMARARAVIFVAPPSIGGAGRIVQGTASAPSSPAVALATLADVTSGSATQITGTAVRLHDDVLTIQQGKDGLAVRLPQELAAELTKEQGVALADFFRPGTQVAITGLLQHEGEAPVVEAFTITQQSETRHVLAAQATTLAGLAEHTHTLITISDLRWTDTDTPVGSALEAEGIYTIQDADERTVELYIPATSALVEQTVTDSEVTFTGVAVAQLAEDGTTSYQLVAVEEGDLLFGDAGVVTPEVPEVFALEANYPNPFNPQTQIRFGLPEASEVLLTVYDVRGREVATLVQGALQAGTHTVTFSGQGLASGLYFYRIEAGSFEATKSMLLLK